MRTETASRTAARRGLRTPRRAARRTRDPRHARDCDHGSPLSSTCWPSRPRRVVPQSDRGWPLRPCHRPPDPHLQGWPVEDSAEGQNGHARTAVGKRKPYEGAAVGERQSLPIRETPRLPVCSLRPTAVAELVPDTPSEHRHPFTDKNLRTECLTLHSFRHDTGQRRGFAHVLARRRQQCRQEQKGQGTSEIWGLKELQLIVDDDSRSCGIVRSGIRSLRRRARRRDSRLMSQSANAASMPSSS